MNPHWVQDAAAGQDDRILSELDPAQNRPPFLATEPGNTHPADRTQG